MHETMPSGKWKGVPLKEIPNVSLNSLISVQNGRVIRDRSNREVNDVLDALCNEFESRHGRLPRRASRDVIDQDIPVVPNSMPVGKHKGKDLTTLHDGSVKGLCDSYWPVREKNQMMQDIWAMLQKEYESRFGTWNGPRKHPCVEMKKTASDIEIDESLLSLAESHGLQMRAKRIGDTASHWMIDYDGCRVVDYWPSTNRANVFCPEKQVFSFSSIEDAIEYAGEVASRNTPTATCVPSGAS